MSAIDPSRRLFLAAGSSAAVFAALHAAASSEADPIFAAIERHKRAAAAFAEACNLTDEVMAEEEGRQVSSADEAIYDAADREEIEALESLVATPPATRQGALATLQYFAEYHRVTFDGGDAFSAFVSTLVKAPWLWS